MVATEAELDVGLAYEIVCAAAGNSWMFGDRGKRMIADGGVDECRKTSFRLVTLLHIAHYFYNRYIFFVSLSHPTLLSYSR